MPSKTTTLASKSIKHPIPYVEPLAPEVKAASEKIKKMTDYLHYLKKMVKEKRVVGNLTGIQANLSWLDRASDDLRTAIAGNNNYDDE